MFHLPLEECTSQIYQDLVYDLAEGEDLANWARANNLRKSIEEID